MATSVLNSGMPLYYRTYTTTTDKVVPAGGRTQYEAGSTSNTGLIFSTYINNYSTAGLSELISYGYTWYSHRMIAIYNPTSSDITIPAGTIISYLMKRP